MSSSTGLASIALSVQSSMGSRAIVHEPAKRRPVETGMLIMRRARHLALVKRVADTLRRCLPILDWRVKTVDGVGAGALSQKHGSLWDDIILTGKTGPEYVALVGGLEEMIATAPHL
jgi:hypothetical protein